MECFNFYAYESKAYWDKEKKQSRSKRTLIGRVDPETREITKTDGRCKKNSPHQTVKLTEQDEIMNRLKGLFGSLKSAEAAKEKQKSSYEFTIAEKNAIIRELTNKLAYMATVADHDGTNTVISTAFTPINKKKVISTSRHGSDKSKGGQPGHERHIMEGFDASDITDVMGHGLNLSAECCDLCDGELIDTGETVSKDEFDVVIDVERTVLTK